MVAFFGVEWVMMGITYIPVSQKYYLCAQKSLRKMTNF